MDKKDIKYSSVHYVDYLELDKILNAQHPRSELAGKTAHDEMLFIIIHQVYELWFKQLLHEIGSIINDFQDNIVDEREIASSVSKLDRVIEIQKVLIQQINVLETMTPLDFLEFRSYLFPASGFQSKQFREVEVLLGLRREQRISYLKDEYDTVFESETKSRLQNLEKNPSLFDLVEDWLERMPFLEFEDFNFLEMYKNAVEEMYQKEEKAINQSSILKGQNKKMRLENLQNSKKYFDRVLNKEKHQQSVENGEIYLSFKATLGALMITLYRDEPILWMPYNFLSKLVEVDEFFTTWRYRHAQMVLRMLGKKMGTGGSSGHDYLKKTAEKHHVFRDFHNISTLLVPRAKLPILPENLKKQLGFYFTNYV